MFKQTKREMEGLKKTNKAFRKRETALLVEKEQQEILEEIEEPYEVRKRKTN